MKERLRSIRYGIGDLGHAIVAPFRKLSVVARRRLVALILLVVAIVLIVTVAVPALPCSFPGGDACAPEDEAIALVPDDALAYVHANLDPETDEYADFAGLAGELPLFGGQIAERAAGLLEASGGEALDFDEDVRPWFGGEVAVVLIEDVRNPEPVELIEIADAGGADEFAETVTSGEVETAEVGGFLAIGSADGVAAIEEVADVEADVAPLADDETATAVLDELPEHRVIEAWVSAAGIEELIAESRSGLDSLTPLLAPGASEGAAASLGSTEDGDGFELAVRSSLDPEEAKDAPGFFAAFPAFEPELPERLPAGSLAYLGFSDPGRTVRSLLAQAGEQAPGIAESFTDLADNLREEAGLNVAADLLGALGDEAALTLDATSSSGTSSSAGQPFPYLSFITTDVEEASLREAFAALQAPLGDVSTEQQIAGVDARTLQVSTTVSVTYAIADGVAVAATSPDGVAAVLGDDQGGLEESENYAAATEDFPEEVSLIGYVDLQGLVALAEELGLAEDPVYATFAGEFRRLDSVGFEVSSADDFLATDARLLIGEERPVDDSQSVIPAPPED